MRTFNPEIEKKLTLVSIELDECMALLTELQKDECNFLVENLAQAIGSVVVAKLQVEENSKTSDQPWEPSCCFCKKPESAVGLLVLGPNVQICNECVITCSNIVEENEQANT